MTIPGLLLDRAAASPDQAFAKCGGTWITHAEMVERAGKVATAVRSFGIEPGDRVAVIVPNREEMLDLVFGLAFAGVVAVPLNAWLKGDFLAYQLRDADPSLLIADEAGVRAAQPLLGATGIRHVLNIDAEYPDLVASSDPASPASVDPQGIASIIYTSGTTGDPKGCMLSHSYYLRGPGCLVERGWLVTGDRLFTAWPLFHTSGQVIALMGALQAKGSVIFEPEFSASTFVGRARSEQATVLAGVGFMGAALLAQPPRADDRDNPFRAAWWIPMGPQLQVAFEDRFDTPVLCEAFGQTECFPITMASAAAIRQRSTLGPPVDHFEVALVDDHNRPVEPGAVGEIVVRPREPGVMHSGYWRNPAATADSWRNLWHHTGDLARADLAGNLSFVDRRKDAIRRRGENVSSLELEAAINQHPAVAQVVVSAVPAEFGEDDIKASLVLVDDAFLEREDFFEFVRDRVPYFAVPRYVDIRPSLPVNALGRVMKHVLRAEGIQPGMWDLEQEGLRVGREERR